MARSRFRGGQRANLRLLSVLLLLGSCSSPSDASDEDGSAVPPTWGYAEVIVVDIAGEPVPTVDIAIRTPDGETPDSLYYFGYVPFLTGGTGRLRVPLPPGHYFAYAVDGSAVETGRQKFTVTTQQSSEVTLTFAKAKGELDYPRHPIEFGEANSHGRSKSFAPYN